MSNNIIIITLHIQTVCAIFFFFFGGVGGGGGGRQTLITDTFANSTDPDEMAHHELSHQNLHCLPCHTSIHL